MVCLGLAVAGDQLGGDLHAGGLQQAAAGRDYSNFVDALPVVHMCREEKVRLIHFLTCEVYGKTIGAFLPAAHLLKSDPAFYMLKEDETPCAIFGSIDEQRWVREAADRAADLRRGRGERAGVFDRSAILLDQVEDGLHSGRGRSPGLRSASVGMLQQLKRWVFDDQVWVGCVGVVGVFVKRHGCSV